MPNEPERDSNAQPTNESMRSEAELDREPGSNRGSKGQMRESRQVARSAEDDIQTMGGHDDPGRSDRSDKPQAHGSKTSDTSARARLRPR